LLSKKVCQACFYHYCWVCLKEFSNHGSFYECEQKPDRSLLDTKVEINVKVVKKTETVNIRDSHYFRAISQICQQELTNRHLQLRLLRAREGKRLAALVSQHGGCLPAPLLRAALLLLAEARARLRFVFAFLYAIFFTHLNPGAPAKLARVLTAAVDRVEVVCDKFESHLCFTGAAAGQESPGSGGGGVAQSQSQSQAQAQTQAQSSVLRLATELHEAFDLLHAVLAAFCARYQLTPWGAEFHVPNQFDHIRDITVKSEQQRRELALGVGGGLVEMFSNRAEEQAAAGLAASGAIALHYLPLSKEEERKKEREERERKEERQREREVGEAVAESAACEGEGESSVSQLEYKREFEDEVGRTACAGVRDRDQAERVAQIWAGRQAGISLHEQILLKIYIFNAKMETLSILPLFDNSFASSRPWDSAVHRPTSTPLLPAGVISTAPWSTSSKVGQGGMQGIVSSLVKTKTRTDKKVMRKPAGPTPEAGLNVRLLRLSFFLQVMRATL
jgi:hypothetical protein